MRGSEKKLGSVGTLVYSPLVEERGTEGWDKETLRFIIDNKKEVLRKINNMCNGTYSRRLDQEDINDIYMSAIDYFYRCDDYNIEKAMERSSSGEVVTLSGYIYKCIGYCVKRYITSDYEDRKNTIPDTVVSSEGEELNLLDKVPNKDEMDLRTPLEVLCKEYEYKRFICGTDSYLVWFIKLLAIRYNKTSEDVDNLMIALDIERSNLRNINKERDKIEENDDMMLEMAKAVNDCGVENAIEVFRGYVYSASRIEEALGIKLRTRKIS